LKLHKRAFAVAKGAAGIIFIAGLLCSALGAWVVARNNEAQTREAVAAAADDAASAVLDRLQRYQYGLRGARGAVVTAGENLISRNLFRRYSFTRNIESEFPGARGFGFVRLVPQADEARFLARARADGAPDFAIQQFASHEGDRYVIQYVEPVEENAAGIGIDIASETNRREAAQAAVRTGEARLTGPITLAQTRGKPQQSFLILMPIYRTMTTPASVAEREAAAFGWTYAALQMEEVLSGLGFENQPVHLLLRDVTVPARPDQFYESPDLSTKQPTLYTQRLERDVFGRKWQIEFSVHPLFIKRMHQLSPRLVMLIGTLISVLLAALAGVLSLSRQRRAQIGAEQARLAAIVDSSADAIIGTTLQGVVTSWNKGAEQLFGHDADDAVGHSVLDLLVPAHLAAEERTILASIARGEPIANFGTQRRRSDGHLLDVSITVSPIHGADGRVLGISKTVRDISAQKAAQARIRELNSGLEEQVAQRTAELRQVNVLLGSVLRSASEVSIIATDVQGIIRVFNHGAERLLGYAAYELIDKSTPAVIHVADEIAARGAALSAEYGKPIEGFAVFVHKPQTEGAEMREWTYVRKDGSHFPVTLVTTAMRDDHGQVTGYLGIAVDITERKAAERELAVSLETTRAILDTAINPVITVDASGTIRSFNPAGSAVFGYRADEMIGQSIKRLLPESYGASYDDYIARFAQNGLGAFDHGRELAGLRKDGSIFPAQVSIGSMVLENEQSFVCVITDVTEQQNQRNELAAARDQLLLAAETAELGIWSLNLKDLSSRWNERMFEIYGLPDSPRNRAVGYDLWRSRIHPEDVDATVASLAAALEGREAYVPSFRIVHTNGQLRYIQARARVERDANGKPIWMTGINRDVTAQHELELRLREAKEQADAASAAKSSFLANMSHEIRTPMNAVLGMLQLMQLTDLSQRQLDYATKAQTAAKSLLGLLNDILDYSKIEAGKLQLDPQPFDLESLMQDLGVVLSGNQGQKDVEVMFDLDPALPTRLIGDSMRLQQVLINLAGNALKFTLSGQVMVSIEVLARGGSCARLRIAVTDSGIGIGPDQLQRIFEGFNQAEASTTRRFGGTGLGLVICKRLVASMGGDLRVESVLGAGSRFWFEVELEVEESPPVTNVAPEIDRAIRVLVADDNAIAAESLMRTVTALGWHAERATGGIDAIGKVSEASRRGEAYDVVLMDWRMPDLDGLSASRSIRADERAFPPPVVIMVTAYGREVLIDAREEGRAPFAGFLTKPVTPKQLADAVMQALQGASLPAPASRARAAKRVRRLDGMKLLVVEDNALNRQVAAELLGAEGAQVQLAEGGLDGVRMVLAGKTPFDAVLMDIQMPDIDGLEATRRIRQVPRYMSLPIVAMTANASDSDRDACLAAGMNDHVGKPIDVESLVRVLLDRVEGKSGNVPHTLTQPAPLDGPLGLVEAKASIIGRFGGNLDLIHSSLSGFDQEVDKHLTRLRERVSNRDSAGAASVLHTVKGTAGTMGAKALAVRAGVLERDFQRAGASSATAIVDDDELAELDRLLSESVRQLQSMFPDQPLKRSMSIEPLDPAQWRGRLHEILALLESSNLQAIALAETVSTATPAALRVIFDQLLEQIRALNFTVAALTVRKMLE
jgi:PAS domain S-box-containing protein